jgi:hypothetical protein
MVARRVFRLGVAVFAVGVIATASPGVARSALFFLVAPTTAKPGDLVTVRTGGTPANFTLQQRSKPFQKQIRLYLVANAQAGQVRSRFDARLQFIGALVPDTRGRGVLSFNVPALGSGSYAVAAWCPGCTSFSRGRTFFVQRVGGGVLPRYRPLMLLRLSAPNPALTCPVTVANGSTPPGLQPLSQYHGNGALWALLPGSGVYRERAESDGTIFEKILWFAAGIDGGIAVVAQRLDASAASLRTQAVLGSPAGFRGSGAWADRVWFSSAGCWKLTGRIRDVSLSYVVEVILEPTNLRQRAHTELKGRGVDLRLPGRAYA